MDNKSEDRFTGRVASDDQKENPRNRNEVSPKDGGAAEYRGTTGDIKFTKQKEY